MISTPVKDHEHAPNYPRRLDLALTTGLALAVRLAWVWFGSWVSGDSTWYLSVARNVAFNHVFSADGSTPVPTAYRPPLYPAVIAALWFVESTPISAVLLLQVFLGTATVGLIYLIARDQFNRQVAVLAGVCMALAPMSGRFTAVILTETLFVFLLTLGVFLWGRTHYFLTGIVFGLAVLTRTTLLPFVILLPLLTLIPAWRSCRRPYASITILSLAIASIWTIRNVVEFKRFIPVAAAGYGTNLLLGTMDTSAADDVPTRKALLRTVDGERANASVDETEFDRTRLRSAVRRIADQPLHWIVVRAQQYPRLFIDNGSYMFGSEGLPLKLVLKRHRVGQAFVRIVFIAGNVVVFLFALLGLVAERARFVALSHLTLFPIFLAAIHLPLWIEPRYGLPMMPLVVILGAVGLTRSVRRL